MPVTQLFANSFLTFVQCFMLASMRPVPYNTIVYMRFVCMCRRSGVFDWLLGRQAIHWSQQEVFFHNFAGMALRGLVWTAPQGYILYHLGYGWQHSLSGSLMSTVYAVGYLIPTYKHLAVGTGWSEVLWGYWVWLVMIFSALAGLLETLRETHGGHSGHTKQTPPYLSSFISKRWLAILFEVWNGVLCSLFIFSTTFYAFVQQKDVRNKGQTFFGMIVVSLVMLAAQLVVLTAVWVTQKKDIDLTYELRGVAILCNSPLILRNKVRFSPHRFGTQPNDTVEGQQFLPYHPADTDSHHWDDVREQRPRDLGFESDASEQQGIRSRNRLGLASEVMDDTPQNDLTDAEAEDFVDWSQVFAEASESRLELWVRKIPFELWSFAEKHIYTSMPAAIRLVLGLISLLACVATTCITIAITCWNIKGQRFLVACNCTQ